MTDEKVRRLDLGDAKQPVEVVNELRCILRCGALRATLAQSIPIVTANLGEGRDDRLDLTPVGAGTATTGFENDCGSMTGSATGQEETLRADVPQLLPGRGRLTRLTSSAQRKQGYAAGADHPEFGEARSFRCLQVHHTLSFHAWNHIPGGSLKVSFSVSSPFGDESIPAAIKMRISGGNCGGNSEATICSDALESSSSADYAVVLSPINQSLRQAGKCAAKFTDR